MGIKAGLMWLILLLALPLGNAFPGAQMLKRTDVCQSGLYGIAVALLGDYQPAQQYCKQKYPVQCTVAKVKRSGLFRRKSLNRSPSAL